MADRVLVLGLDSASLSWVRGWVAEGRLPNLGRVLERSAVGVLRSVLPPISPAAWSSFATGMQPGKHGVYDHIYRRPGSYDVAPTNAASRRAAPIWQLISEAGGKVGVVNVPETYPPAAVNGFMLSGMDTPSDDADFAYPAELKVELERAVGGYLVFGERSKEDLDKSIAGMYETIPMRARAGQYLWESYRPDLMVLVFMETDVIQHKCWMYMDPEHPDHQSPKAIAGREKYQQTIPDIYSRIDAALGPWLGSLDGDTTVIIMSDHGAGPLSKFLYINNWLIQEGFQSIQKTPLARAKWLVYRMGFSPSWVFDFASRWKLGVVDRASAMIKRDMVAAGRTTFLQRLFLSWKDIDWSSTKAYALGGNYTGIYLNLKEREPQGIVEPGAEYEELRQQLAARLRDWKDPESGEPVVERVILREDLYEGRYTELAPDIVFTTRSDLYVGSVGHEFASNKLMSRSRLFNGHHRMEGMFAISGSGIKPGPIEARSIVDLAPTILYLLGHPIPADMDGQIITEAFRPEFLADRSIEIDSGSGLPEEAAEGPGAYSAAEEEEIINRLSDLGYF